MVRQKTQIIDKDPVVLDANPPVRMDNYSEMRRAFFYPAGLNEPDAMHQEKMDARMVSEDHTAMANCPREGYQVEWNVNSSMQRLGTDRGISYPANTARKR